jgi:hypothetical protein
MKNVLVRETSITKEFSRGTLLCVRAQGSRGCYGRRINDRNSDVSEITEAGWLYLMVRN